MRTGLLRPRLHSTQTVSTLLSPTHYWAPWDRRTWLWTLLTSENLGSQEWAVQRPPGEWLLQGLKCWMPCLSLPCWPKPRHFYMLLSFPQGARQMTAIHGCHGCLVLYRYGPCVRRFAFTCSIWQTLFCSPGWHHHPAAMSYIFCPSYSGILKQRTRHHFLSAVQ